MFGIAFGCFKVGLGVLGGMFSIDYEVWATISVHVSEVACGCNREGPRQHSCAVDQ